ncbi:hypothetical protein D3C81_570060 [compost metagenome]
MQGVAQVLEDDHLRIATVLVRRGQQTVDHLDAASRADAARRAFATGFLGAELHGETRHVGHVQSVVSHHHTAVTEHRAHGGEGFVIQRRIELRGRNPGTKRTTHLRSLQRPATGGPAAVVFHQLPQGQAKGPFHQTAVTHIARQLEGHGAQRTAHAVITIKLRTLGQNQRHRGQRQHVVHQRRQAEQTLQRRNRRLGANDPTLAFQRVQQRGFFTADVSTGPDAHVHIESQAAAADIGAEVTGSSGDVQRCAQRRHGIRIFRAHIDVAEGGADGNAGNRHAFDQQEGVAFHQHAVGKGA